jgi:F-type H+-transporting ATPase subunit a
MSGQMRQRLLSTCVTAVLLAAAGGLAYASEEGGEPGNWLTWLYGVKIAGIAPVSNPARLAFAWSLLTAVVVAALAMLGTRQLSLRPSRRQVLLEMIVSGLKGMTVSVIGPRGAGFAPFIGSLFLYIMMMNLMGLIPGFLAPTSSLSVTAALALIVFVVVQFYGLKEHGFKYFAHFIEGVPRSIWYLPLAALVFVVHLLGELARPLTLAIRLFGNIMAGETLLAVLTGMSVAIMLRYKLPIPLQFPNLVLEVLVAVVQAAVFAMLTCVYLSGVVGAEEEAHG